MSRTNGLVVGRFAPPHQGSVLVLDFAVRLVDELTIVLLASPDEEIGADVRASWLSELCPRATIAVLDLRSQPGGNRLYQALPLSGLARSVEGLLQRSPSLLFGSDPSLQELSRLLGCKYIPVDPARAIVPVSGRDIRADPLKWWQYIPRCARPHFVKRVCIFGPESTGKTTLAKDLAGHFHTVAVPEWARTYLDLRNNELVEEDLPLFARGQAVLEDASAREANRVLICDTDAITTLIWSEWLYGRCDEAVRSLADSRRYDLYLLTDVDVPWVEDPQRYLPDDRRAFFDRCRQELVVRDRRYEVISGTWQERFERAVGFIERMLLETAPQC